MSKFMDRLQKAGTQSPKPLGFGVGARKSEATPSILLVGRTTGAEAKAVAELSQLDAILVSLENWGIRSLNAIGKSLEGKLWGMAVSGLDQERVGLLKEKGCDFIVFEAEDTAAAVLNDDELGKLISVDSNLNEETAHAIQELPIDGVLLSSTDGLLPLTVQKLIGVQLTRGLVDKPFVMGAPPDLGPVELEVLRNAGIGGLLVDVSSPKSIARTREAIAGLPRRKPWVRSEDAVAPHVPPGVSPSSHDDDDDDDDF